MQSNTKETTRKIGGYSWTTFDNITMAVINAVKPAHVLDIGAGEGKYGRIIREQHPNNIHITAVEFETQRRDELLALGYNEVWSIPASKLYEASAHQYDFIILGDVIEHMKKSEGRDLLEFLLYRSKYILIVTPECMPMSSNIFYEGHNCIWRPIDMQWHDLWAHCQLHVMHFYLLRGYLDFKCKSLADVVKDINLQKLIVKQDAIQRVCNLSLHDNYLKEINPLQPNTASVFRPL